MLLQFTEHHREHLSLFNTVHVDVLNEFCHISIQFIQNGTNDKVYQSAAGKLDVEAKLVKQAVEGLMFLFMESSKLMLSDIDFQDSLMLLGYNEEIRSAIFQVYFENRDDIRKILNDLTVDRPHYYDLEWRYDIQLASRSLRQQINPLIMMKIHIKNGDKIDTHLLQTDPTNLIHLTKTLEDALNEMKTSHCRRIVRNI